MRDLVAAGLSVTRSRPLRCVPHEQVTAVRPIHYNRLPSAIVTGRTNTPAGRPVAT
jgi:hypothetical protein